MAMRSTMQSLVRNSSIVFSRAFMGIALASC